MSNRIDLSLPNNNNHEEPELPILEQEMFFQAIQSPELAMPLDAIKPMNNNDSIIDPHALNQPIEIPKMRNDDIEEDTSIWNRILKLIQCGLC